MHVPSTPALRTPTIIHMNESCKHEFEYGRSLFTGTVQSRKCRGCERIEVMLTTGIWVDIEAYLQRQLANRSIREV